MLAFAPIASAEKSAKKDIVDTAVAAGSFNTLAAALKAGGLVDALQNGCRVHLGPARLWCGSGRLQFHLMGRDGRETLGVVEDDSR